MKDKIKLFVIVDRGIIRAITEEKKIAKRFLEERTNSGMYYQKITDKKIANRILVDCEDDYITEEPLLGILITQKESKYFVDEIYQEIARLRSTLRDLEWMKNKYNLPDNIQSELDRGVEALQKMSKPKHIRTIFGIPILSKALISSHRPLDKYMKS